MGTKETYVFGLSMTQWSPCGSLNQTIIDTGVNQWPTLANYEPDELASDLGLDMQDQAVEASVSHVISTAQLIEKGLLRSTSVALETAPSIATLRSTSTTSSSSQLGLNVSEPFARSARFPSFNTCAPG